MSLTRQSAAMRDLARGSSSCFVRPYATLWYNPHYMKTKSVITAVFAALLTSCATVPEAGYTTLPNSRDFNASYDRVWGAVVSLVSERSGVKNIDKASGLITTEPFAIGSGFLAQNALQQYAYQPPNLLGTWGAGRGELSILVMRKGEKTSVRVTGRFEGFENNVSHSWMAWPTKGVLENAILKRLGEMLGQSS